MEKPPFDPLAEYLEAHAILSSLHLERTRLFEYGAELDKLGVPADAEQRVDLASLLYRLSAGIEETETLLLTYELYLEEQMRLLADRADAGRALFAAVSARILEMKTRLLDSADNEQGYNAHPKPQSSDTTREAASFRADEHWEWEVLLRDYERIRVEWIKMLPVSDWPLSDD